MDFIILIVLMLTGLLFELALIFGTIYGIVVCFKKKWYFGLIGLIFPIFALVVGVAKLFKKDLLS